MKMKHRLTKKYIVIILFVTCITVLFTQDLDNLWEAFMEGYNRGRNSMNS